MEAAPAPPPAPPPPAPPPAPPAPPAAAQERAAAAVEAVGYESFSSSFHAYLLASAFAGALALL